MSEARMMPQDAVEAKARAMMESAREKYWTLSECLNIVEATTRNFSRSENGLTPKDGYEKAWEREKRKAEVIRGMMREVRVDCGWP